MQLSLPYQEFSDYVKKQIKNFFPDSRNPDRGQFIRAFDQALDRTDFCFKHVVLAAYHKKDDVFLNHLHSDQYAVFLWFLSNSVWKLTEDEETANKLFYLNKSLHGLSCMYDTCMPEIFLLLHTVGVVLGKATYGDFFVATQGSTVGAQHGKYPIIGKGVSLLPYSAVIGECNIGDGVSIGIHSVVYQQDVPASQVVITRQTNVQHINDNNWPWAQRFYDIPLYDNLD